MVRGPQRGYLLEPTKRILVVSTRHVPTFEEYFRGIGVRVVTGNHYLGIFVGDPMTEKSWIDDKVKG